MPKIDLDEIESYIRCPEQERRRKLDPYKGLTALEYRYRKNLRKIFVRFYSELLDGNRLTLAQLRRSWSTMWNDIPMDDGIKPRSFSKGTSSDLNALMTDPERLLVRGAGVLHKFSERLMHDGIQPVIVDEPFSIELDGITIEGKFDVVFEDRDHRYWIIDWSNKELRYDHQYDRRLAILLAAFSTTTGKVAAGVIVDYIMTFGDFYDFSVRTVDALKDQVLDVTQVAKAITQNIVYKDVGPNCKSCPYKNSCVGIRIVQQKRPVGRPRRRANVPGPQ